MMRAVSILAILLVAASPAAGETRDELLRVAPADAAIVVIVQNARDNYRNLAQSPFAQWAPSTAIGKRILESAEFRQLRDSAAMIFRELDTTPETIIDDVVGDTVAFAFSPAHAASAKDERAVLLIRPRKTETLRKLLDRVNELQTKSGELKAIHRKEHAGMEYVERQKSAGASEFYCFRGDVFAFSSSEADIRGLLDRDKAAPPIADKTPELVARMKRLGVSEAAGLILINPRALDAELTARVAAAKPDEKRFLARFAEAWAALDAAAIYARLDTGVELGVSLRFQPGRLPPDLKKWLTGPADGSTSASLLPADALVGVAAHVRAVELIDLIASIAPVEAGKPGVKDFIDQALGPFFGRDKLATVLNALGPNWAVWAEPPSGQGFLPTIVAAVEIGGTSEERQRAEKALVQGIEFGVQLLRVGYNASHTDQIEFKEETKNGIVVRSLVNDTVFPPGFRPSFAMVKGYLVIATSPEPILRFTPPPANPERGRAERTIARFSGTGSRAYLQTHGPRLARFLTEMGIVRDEKPTREMIDMLAAALELIESAELVIRPDENGLQIALKIKPARPLKK
jgi:hypothetical protein